MELIYNFFHQGLSAIGPFVLLLGLLIFVHELGHFLVAVWCGVRVEVFSLGFGKKIFKYQRGDTTYCISLIPLGGYVKMFGDEYGSTISDDQKPFAFTHKNVWQRIAIVLAGPLMNFFFAILIFALIAMIGEEVRTPKVGDVAQDSLAYQAGFRSGDEILRVDSGAIQTWDDFQEIINSSHDRKLRIEVRRDHAEQVATVEATPRLKPNPNILSIQEMVGDIEGLSASSLAPVIGIRYESGAYHLGLRTGDQITAINGQRVTYFRELESLLIPLQEQTLSLDVERPINEQKVDKISIKGLLPKLASLSSFGIETPDLYLAKVLENSPALQAGLRNGDRILAVNETKTEKWDDVLQTVRNYGGEGAMRFSVQRKDKTLVFSVVPKLTSQMTSQGGEESRYTVGIMPWIQLAVPVTKLIKIANPFVATGRAIHKTMNVTGMTIVSFLRLIQNKISPKNIGGVISIGQVASETFKIGLSHFFQMMALISVHLFILNLLPIPVLDGGHLLFYTVEALRGAPLSMRKMEIAQQVGLVVLMSLMVFALFNDFSRLLGFW